MKTLSIVCFLFLLCMSCQKISYEEMLTNKEIAVFAKEVKRETGLRLIGFGGGSSNGKLTHFALIFSGSQYPDVDEARWIYFSLATRFIDQVNQNEELEPYFANFPLTVFDNLNLMVLFADSTTSVSGVDMGNLALPFKREFVSFTSYDPVTQTVGLICKERYEDSMRLYEQQKMNRGPFWSHEETSN
jgi:hypothetical protein